MFIKFGKWNYYYYIYPLPESKGTDTSGSLSRISWPILFSFLSDKLCSNLLDIILSLSCWETVITPGSFCLDFRAIVPNKGHLRNLSLYCPDFVCSSYIRPCWNYLLLTVLKWSKNYKGKMDDKMVKFYVKTEPHLFRSEFFFIGILFCW